MTYTFMKSKEELFDEGKKKHIGVVMDGLSAEETKNAMEFIEKCVQEDKIYRPGYRNTKEIKEGKQKELISIGFSFHECLRMYPMGKRDKKSETEQIDIGRDVEFIRLLTVDEIWYFDKGENMLPIDGRLYNKLKDWEIPIRLLCRIPDKNTWEFYRGIDFEFDEKTEEVEEYEYLIGEIEPYEPTEEELASVPEEPVQIARHFDKDEMDERTYDLAWRALGCMNRAFAIKIGAMVRLDDENDEKIGKFNSEAFEVFTRLQTEPDLTEEFLKTCEAKLDFLEEDMVNV